MTFMLDNDICFMPSPPNISVFPRQKQQIMQLHARIRENELRAQQVLQNQRGRSDDSYALKTKVLNYACKYDELLIRDVVKDVTFSAFLLRRARWTALHRLDTVLRLQYAARTESWGADWPQPSSRSSTSKSSSSRTHRNTQRTSRSWRRRSAGV